MDITLEKKAIVFRIKSDSYKLTPIMHFVKNSFKNVKYLQNLTIISDDESELIRKRYLLKWAYKNTNNNSISLKELIKNVSLPIYVINASNTNIEKTLHITVNHINTNNELYIRCNEYNHTIVSTFEKLFKNTITFSPDKRIFKIKIKTKYDLALLKSVLSRKKISGVSVVFITNGLNFSKINTQNIVSEEQIYERKLQKSYKVLGITQNCSDEKVKINYKKLLRKYHPDKVCAKGIETVKLYTKRFQIVQEAYGFIKEHNVQYC